MNKKVCKILIIVALAVGVSCLVCYGALVCYQSLIVSATPDSSDWILTNGDYTVCPVIDDDSVENYTEYLSENNKDYGFQRVANPDDYKDSMAFVSAIMVLVFAMAIIMIVYVIGSLNKIIITERLPVIGTFRSIGATKHKMNGILVLENALYGLIGGVIGVFGGYLLNE